MKKIYKNHELLAMLHEICAIIYFQQDTKHQDRWLEDKIDVGIWDTELGEDEEYENGFKMEG
jgi:hypothetical protein|tara:strand:- start:3556 stop:3741 length:186 start_codon:yes stop_codon:yes gene_type:complete